MSGKGSGRRPQEAPDDEVKESWERIFGRKPERDQQAPRTAD